MMAGKRKCINNQCIDTAVILAAGLGMRLRNTVADRPKGFVRLGNRPIIEESLQRLYHAGVEKVIIITGYRHTFYEDLCTRYTGLETVHNAEYAVSGSLYSLYCARQQLEGDFLLLESDLVYESMAIEELLRVDARDVLLMSGPTGAGDEVFVETRNGKLAGMSKDIKSLNRVDGELVGISRLSHDFFQEVLTAAEHWFTKTLYLDYETDGFIAAVRQREMLCHKIEDLAWCEIDDPGHLRRAQEIIYPEILRRDAGLLARPKQTDGAKART